MELLLGKVIAIFLIVMGLAMLWNREFFIAAGTDAVKNKGLMLFGGALNLIIGLLLVLSHNVWTNDWQVLVTLFGWLSLLKGLFILFFPDHVIAKAKKMMSESYAMHVGGMVMFLLGLYMMYATFNFVA